MSEGIEELRAKVAALKSDGFVSGSAKRGETIKSSLTELSRVTGIPLSTLSRFASGRTKNMTPQHAQAVSAYVEALG